MRICALLLALAAAAAAAEPPPAFAPLAFLAGHCWRGTFPGGQQTDEHCFSWVYDAKFVRDRHVVRGEGHPDYLGESIYYWDSAAKQLEYLYIESDGGFSRGAVTSERDALVFPPTAYVENGQTKRYRSRWQRVGEDAYDVVTEFEAPTGWAPGFSVHMQRLPAAAP